MKKRILICFIALLSVFKLFAQTDAKYDVILKTNGEEMIGKITAINDNSLVFTFKGETLVYTVKKADINKVTFASGRVQIFNQPQAQPSTQTAPPQQAAPVDTKNLVAILPFGLIVGGQAGSEAMQTQIQNDCYAAFTQKTITMKFQDPAATNVILYRNNVNPETIKGFTMDDLCHMLGVEYIISGVVTLNHSSSTTTGGGSSTSTTKKTDSKDKTTTYSSGSSSSYDNYTTTILMNVYDHGTQIFTKSHQAFWPGIDAYKGTLSYLAKRTPIYGR